ncbi:DNA-binding transcriptional MocR family regulator [Crossiella equi]|uniref:DNA-binding transcriptional MocR family regulator n=1 Tax=Crossiella equi TaxID=130796 RepID=A0ABS5AN04_9PSEU|nr:aminotransferase class I/II-fold pyridoxal phosphate-dependent enzyme [Crossiella equi]MBP2477948.1 DNA-binding transcriptional MocR family regulator [Crossiella equi]
MDLTTLAADEVPAVLADLRKAYDELTAQNLSLDLTRGKPAAAQLDLSNDLLTLPGKDVVKAGSTDTRNYGGLNGLPELREIFAGPLGVPVAQLLALGNSSLSVMHETIVFSLLKGPVDGQPWVGQGVKFLCPVPGYDRHFHLIEQYGIEAVPVPMTETGPDMDVVERLVAEDASIKGIWCVPKYANPTGTVYSEDTVRRLATMQTAAPDFRLFWDNAYALHHLTPERVEIANVLELATEAGNANRPFIFASSSKITFAGAGVAFFGASPENVAWLTKNQSFGTIGPDKVNQLRHVAFLKDTEGLLAHMDSQRAVIEPKFAIVLDLLEKRLAGSGVAEWSKPKGGYFISLDVLDGTAKRVVALAKEAGIVLTPAGATFPHGNDPRDRNIRLAPTFPAIAEVEKATEGVITCVLLAAAEKLAQR